MATGGKKLDETPLKEDIDPDVLKMVQTFAKMGVKPKPTHLNN